MNFPSPRALPRSLHPSYLLPGEPYPLIGVDFLLHPPFGRSLPPRILGSFKDTFQRRSKYLHISALCTQLTF